MTSPRTIALCLLLLTPLTLATAADAQRELRVCADPDGLPFSNNRLAGFENKIAEVVANDLHASLQYAWFPQSGGAIRQALISGRCTVVMGAPAGWGPVLTTRPYYSSTYVFVYPKNKHLNLSSFDDPVLRNFKIGLPVISNEGGANPPPAYALARRGLAGNVIGFSTFPPGKIIEAVAAGEIDVAIVWGPFGGYFAKHQPVHLAVTPVSASEDGPPLRFNYDISMGVKQGNTAFKNQLERVLDRRHKEIRKILENYGVPVISPAGGLLSMKSISMNTNEYLKGDDQK